MRQTTLDLNGPILSFVTQPVGVTVNNGQSATFTGVATAFFPTQTPENIYASNTGSLSYRWYAEGYGALSDGSFLGATISGTGSTVLTVTNAQTPETSGVQLYLTADYVSSAYQTSSPVTVGTARSTGNAINEILSSNVVTLNVNPLIVISTQPSSSSIAQGQSTSFSVSSSATDGSSVSYQWYVNGTAISDGSSNLSGFTFSGSTTPTLTVSTSVSASVNSYSIFVRISHPTGSNSPLDSNSVTLEVISARAIMNYENFNESTPSVGGSGSVDLSQGPFTYSADTAVNARSTCVYVPERNVRVRMTMAASAGAPRNGNLGGEGGVSVFEVTLYQNVEYIFKLGVAQGTGGGPNGGTNGGGGPAVFYRQGTVLVACGGGGGAGTNGRGGHGGGIGVAGERGQGPNAGNGGGVFATGTMDLNGCFSGCVQFINADPQYKTGGRLSSCTIGDYWRARGYSPCQLMGYEYGRTFDTGAVINGTTNTIVRGYKAGIAYRNSGGNGSGNEGGGASGARSGDAATGNGSGGGGASGYSSGEVTLISTRLGGNPSTRGYVTIQVI